MKKLYTLMLAAASASMMFAQMPIMQHEVSFGMPNPVQMPTEKAELVKHFNQYKSLEQFNASKNNVKFNAPSRADGGLTRDDLCKINFVQDYYTFLSNGQEAINQEYCGSIVFTPGKEANEVVLTGLYGFNGEFYNVALSINGTFDPATQTISFPYEQFIFKNNSYNVYFTGFGFPLNEDHTAVGEAFDFTADDSLVLEVENFYGQWVLEIEGSRNDTWDVIPAFGFLAVDPRTDKAMGWFELCEGERFYLAQASCDIDYQYVSWWGDGQNDYDLIDIHNYGLLQILDMGNDETGIQAGPFIQGGFGCPVMFVYDYGDYVAYETFEVNKKEYKNPAFYDMGNDTYYYLTEITENGFETGIYLSIEAEDNMLLSFDFDCLEWAAVDLPLEHWYGECLPAHVAPCSFEIAGVNEIAAEKVKDGRWFNLQGIEVSKANLQKGNIYINNGKKVLVK